MDRQIPQVWSMYLKNSMFEQSSKLDDDFHPSSKSGLFAWLENLQTSSFILFHQCDLFQLPFLGMSRLIWCVFTLLCQTFPRKIKNLSFWGWCHCYQIKHFAIFMKIVIYLWTLLKPRVFKAHTLNLLIHYLA